MENNNSNYQDHLTSTADYLNASMKTLLELQESKRRIDDLIAGSKEEINASTKILQTNEKMIHSVGKINKDAGHDTSLSSNA